MSEQITAWVNPVTGTLVRLVPPLDNLTEEDREKFDHRFTAWAKACWELARLDPPELNTTHLAPLSVGRTLTRIKVLGLILHPDGTTTLSVRDLDSGNTHQVPGDWRRVQ